MPSQYINIKIPRELYDTIASQAKAEQRTQITVIARAIEIYIAKTDLAAELAIRLARGGRDDA